MRVGVCDDDVLCQGAIVDIIEAWKECQELPLVEVCRYHSSEELLQALAGRSRFDLVFLDIQIPDEMSGIEVARRIRERDERVGIVFVTNYSEYAREGYQVNALRYLQKPVRAEQIYECLDIVYKQWRLTRDESLILNDYRGKTVLLYKNILYIEARGHNLIIHRAVESEPFSVRMSLGKLCERLPEGLFAKCHRAFVVNILYTRRIARDKITLANGAELPVGNRFRDSVEMAFDSYYQGTKL